MDNLTHTLTGLLLSRAGLNRMHPQATPLLLMAANVPDIDVISVFGGTDTYFHYHRWITHALVSIPVMALLPVLIVGLIRRKAPRTRWLPLWGISIAGVASHLLLDWTNPYGIRLFLPWSSAWPGLMITSVIDPWIWSILLLCSLMPLLGRLISSEIGGKPGSQAGLAVVGLLLIGAYDGARYFLHQRAVVILENRVYEGEAPHRVSVYPDTLNPLLWHGIVETGSRFVLQDVSLYREGSETSSRTVFKPEATPAIQAAASVPLFIRLQQFSRATLWNTVPLSGGNAGEVEVSATDLFFRFTARAIVDSSNRVVTSEFHF